MTVVIVGLGADMTFIQGQSGLTALEGLTPTLLIATEQQGAIRWMEIEANHIPELLFRGQIARFAFRSSSYFSWAPMSKKSSRGTGPL